MASGGHGVSLVSQVQPTTLFCLSTGVNMRSPCSSTDVELCYRHTEDCLRQRGNSKQCHEVKVRTSYAPMLTATKNQQEYSNSGTRNNALVSWAFLNNVNLDVNLQAALRHVLAPQEYLDITWVRYMWESKCLTARKLPRLYPASPLVQSLCNVGVWSPLCQIMPPAQVLYLRPSLK